MNANWLICFALVISTIHVIECKGGRGGGRSHSHGGHGSSRGSSSSHNSHGSSGGSSRGSSHGSSSGGSHTYPQSSGYSGNGKGGSHSYPQSPGYSGNGQGGSHSYPQSPGYSGYGIGSGRGSQPWGTAYHAPSYYSSPQHVYVTQYRDSGSRYNNILTGLTLYNLGRSHSHYHHHYYHDSYYRSSTATHTESQNPGDTVNDPKEDATCFLKMIKNRQEELVKVPCAIVSTFSNENNVTSDMNQNNVTSVSNCSSVGNVLLNRLDENNTLNYNEDCVNSTRRVEDPLVVKGEPIDAENMECFVEIRTKENVIQNKVDCEILMKYAKMPVPEKKASGVLPRRETLKAMLDKPPWWLSLFIAA